MPSAPTPGLGSGPLQGPPAKAEAPQENLWWGGISFPGSSPGPAGPVGEQGGMGKAGICHTGASHPATLLRLGIPGA